jgi:hypothetical protein
MNAARGTAKADVPAFAFSSNAPAVRYRLETQSVAAPRQAGDKRLLVVVVPD